MLRTYAIHRYLSYLRAIVDQYVDLEVIDLSELHGLDDSTPPSLRDPSDIITRTMKALTTLGFIVIKGHGLSDEQINHQFSLGKLLAAVPESEKHDLHAAIKEGSWAGYKVSDSSTHWHWCN
jgi:isopenicillin N synthase-like dioxygenase